MSQLRTRGTKRRRLVIVGRNPDDLLPVAVARAPDAGARRQTAVRSL